MERIGVVVNPIAGMGGRVGLKGTDGKLEAARERGATPRAPDRAVAALESLARRRPDLTVVAAGGEMGADAARAAGYEPIVVTDPGDETSAGDTREAVTAFLEDGVDLILFVGGDGTAVDVATKIEEAGAETPMLGVPAGVKVYSSVFGVTPADTGRIAAEYDRVAPREVNDIDEDAYRDGEVRAELKAVVSVPVAPDLQSSKQLASGSVDGLASGFARGIEPGTTYVFGPGSTVGAIEAEVGIEPSPLGVDVWRAGGGGEGGGNESGNGSESDNKTVGNSTLLARDAAESDILEVMGDRAIIVVSPIGGQGFIFGRGNHQISPAVIDRAERIVVVASGAKLDGLETLRVDTDDEQINDELRGWQRVRTGQFTTRLVKVV